MNPMQLPNYFLADLPPDTPLAPSMIGDACQSLRHNRERFLLPKSTEAVIQAIAEVARQWTAPYSPWRALALEQGPAATGFSRETLAAGLDEYFRQLTPRSLQALVVQDLGHALRLDRLISNDAETFQGVSAVVRGPELVVHVTAGKLPTPVFTSIVHGLLVRSAQFVKCATGSSLLPRLFAHSLRDVEPKFASCLEIAEWPGGRRDVEEVVFAEADVVVASGGDESIEAIRKVLPSRVRFLAHGHRVSAGYIAREVLGPNDEDRVLKAAAQDIAAWDQMGCLSPHNLFVETGGMLPPEGFAARLAAELAEVEKRQPRGRVDAGTAEAIFRRREYYQVRAAASDETRCWFSPDSTAWSVVYEADAKFQTTCLHRFVLVKPVDVTRECLHMAEAYRGRWSTVGLASIGLRTEELAQEFAAWGIPRICPLGRMQRPPLTWRHDGRPVLGDLVTWSQHELSPEH